MLTDFFTARRICIAECMQWPGVSPVVRPSRAGIVSKRLNGSSYVSAQTLPSAYLILCYEGIRVSPKNKGASLLKL